LESHHLEIRPKAAARLVLEAPAAWVSPSSRGLWGGDALLLFTRRCWKPKPYRGFSDNGVLRRVHAASRGARGARRVASP
jgi:hypothetical protein